MDWTSVVKEVGPRLFRYFSCSFVPSMAEELVQEVLIRLVRKLSNGDFDPNRGTVSMLAFGIAHHVRLESLRLLAKDQRISDSARREGGAETRANAEQRIEWHDCAAGLRKTLAKLSEEERQIVLLHIDNEFSLSEIAKLLAMPVGTVKSHIHRAKEKLRKALIVIQ